MKFDSNRMTSVLVSSEQICTKYYTTVIRLTFIHLLDSQSETLANSCRKEIASYHIYISHQQSIKIAKALVHI